ncbi:hypothetical protein [Pseudokineococcus sp. 1T1Z-3]|uniref:hypothetical protein n=1 Tax=Pseudokineococcus sp. 1T1Z-3 TaxID=3132745 RepID=UPI0030AB6C41
MRRPTVSRLGGTQVVVAVVVVAALLGAVLGGVLGATRSVSSTAASLMALQPDSSVTSNPDASLDPSVDVSDAFLQTELVYLNSERFTSEVEDAAGGEVDLEATRVNQSNVVQVSATADTPQVALAAAEIAAERYNEVRAEQAVARLDEQAAAVQDQLDTVVGQIDAASTGSVLPPDAGTVTALQGRYENLLTLSSSIGLARQTADQGATILQPAVVSEPDGLPPAALGVVLGALLGALAGAGLALTWRQRSTTLRGEADLVGVDGVLAPRAPLAGAGDLVPVGAGATSPLARSAQRQSAQLLAGRDDTPVVVAMVGAGEGAGTSVLALHHAAAMARRAPVVLVLAGDAVPGATPSPAGSLPGVDTSGRGLLDLGTHGHRPLAAEELLAVAQVSGVEGLLVITAGTRGASASDLEHLANRGLVAALRATGHDVVVDAPSLDRSGAGPRLAALADTCALVAGLWVSSRDDVHVGVRALTADGHGPAVLLAEPASPRERRGRGAAADAVPPVGDRPASDDASGPGPDAQAPAASAGAARGHEEGPGPDEGHGLREDLGLAGEHDGPGSRSRDEAAQEDQPERARSGSGRR